MKKTAASLLVCIFLIQVFSPMAFAATESNAYINEYGAGLSNPSSNVIQVDFHVYGTGYMSSLGANIIYLYEDGALLAMFSRYNPAYTSYMMATNSYRFFGSISYPAKPGSTYYAIVTFFATDGYGTGTEGCTTGTLTIPSSP